MIKKIYNRYKEWFSLFSSAFTGTLLGIGITFGISAYMEHQAKEEMAHKILVITLNEMQNRMTNIEKEIPNMRRTDSIFWSVLCYYPEELDMVPDSLVDAFKHELNTFNLGKQQNFAEQLFLSNIESLEAFDDLSIICDITHLFDHIHQIDDVKNKVEETKRAISNAYSMKDNIYLSDKEVLLEVFKDSQIDSKIIFLKSYTEALSFFLEVYKKDFISVKQNLGIDEKDLESTKSDRGAKIDSTKKKLFLSY